jgi:hypothetical protein
MFSNSNINSKESSSRIEAATARMRSYSQKQEKLIASDSNYNNCSAVATLAK